MPCIYLSYASQEFDRFPNKPLRARPISLEGYILSITYLIRTIIILIHGYIHAYRYFVSTSTSSPYLISLVVCFTYFFLLFLYLFDFLLILKLVHYQPVDSDDDRRVWEFRCDTQHELNEWSSVLRSVTSVSR